MFTFAPYAAYTLPCRQLNIFTGKEKTLQLPLNNKNLSAGYKLLIIFLFDTVFYLGREWGFPRLGYEDC